ncbi:MAG: hypothetical protein ACI84C_001710 [Flavobacteriales bacterium]|jgi:hypothetical protein
MRIFVLACAFIIASFPLLSQEDSTSTSKLNWGVTAGLYMAHTSIEKFEGFNNLVTDNYEVDSKMGYGVSGGFVVAYHISPKWLVKPYLRAALSSAEVQHKFSTEPVHNHQVYPLVAELGALVERELGNGNYRPCVLFGGNISYDIALYEGAELELKPLDFMAQLGVGVKKKSVHSTWSIDLILSIGLRQLALSEGSIYNQSTGKVSRNNLGIYFYFY